MQFHSILVHGQHAFSGSVPAQNNTVWHTVGTPCWVALKQYSNAVAPGFSVGVVVGNEPILLH